MDRSPMHWPEAVALCLKRSRHARPEPWMSITTTPSAAIPQTASRLDLLHLGGNNRALSHPLQGCIMALHISLPGLSLPSRAALRALDDAALADQLVEWMLALRPVALEYGAAVARLAGLPEGEVVASPAAFRAVCLALTSGAATVHHEARAPIAWEEAQQGGAEVESQLHGVWDAGVLHIGKYQSFKQDEPFATYNPNHVAKWAPHELLHRACGFFWADGMSRFDLYASSRINEALPVALWYGWDECCRLQSTGFDRNRTADSREAYRHEARWLTESVDALRDRVRATLGNFRWGLDHAAEEFALVRQEQRERRRLESGHLFLEPSSDARAYVVGHYARLTERSHAMLFSQLLEAGRDYHDDLDSYFDHLESVGDRLLCGPLTLDERAFQSAFARRRVWDLASRAATLGWKVFRGLLPALREAFAKPVDGLPALEAAMASAEPRLLATGVLAAGPSETFLEGLESLSPPTSVWCTGEGAEVLARAWSAGLFLSREPLKTRLRTWLMRDAAVPESVRERFALEVVIATIEQRDDDVEHLCESTPSSDDSRVIGSSAFRCLDLPWTLLLARAEDDGVDVELPTMPPEEYGGLLVGSVRGQVAILPLPKPVVALWEASRTGTVSVGEAAAQLDGWLETHDDGSWPESGEAWLEELAQAGLFGFLG